MPAAKPRATGSGRVVQPAIPPPNLTHPASALIPQALGSSHTHPPSYHSIFTSQYFPAFSSTLDNKGKRGRPKSELPEPLTNAIDASILQAKLLTWFDGVRGTRGMPWRKDGDPRAMIGEAERTQRGYEVWVSEIMLQQTQVATCIGYWTRWMERFPTVQALATASVEDVNAMWKGLGYYSRASRLLMGAQKVVEDFEGKMPESVEDLLKLDGIGPYSAGAVSSIAYGRRSAMVDGNVIRVLSRLTAFHAPSTAKSTNDYIWALADILVPSHKTVVLPLKVASHDGDNSPGGPNKSGSWNQGLMELGATVCTPTNPACHECPLSQECLAYQEVRTTTHPTSVNAQVSALPDLEDLCDLCTPFNLIKKEHAVTRYPMAKEKKKVREEETAVCLLEWRHGTTKKVLLVKRPEKGLLAGLFEFPAIDLPPEDESTVATRIIALHRHLQTILQNKISLTTLQSSKDLGSILQVYSHQKRLYHIHRLVLLSEDGVPPELKHSRAQWVLEDDVSGANIGGAVIKVWDVRNNGQQVKKATVSKGFVPKVEKNQTKLSFTRISTLPRPVSTIPVVGDNPHSDQPSPKKKKRVIVISDEDSDG